MGDESLKHLLETMTRNMESREKQHQEAMEAQQRAQALQQEAMEAQKKAQADALKVQKAQLTALKEAHAQQLKALVDHLPKLAESAASIPSFAAFDPTSELWKDYMERFETFVGANSIPKAMHA